MTTNSPASRSTAALGSLLALAWMLGAPLAVSVAREAAASEPPVQQFSTSEAPFDAARPSGAERLRIPPQAAPLFVSQPRDARRPRASTARAVRPTVVALPALSRWRLAHSTATSSP
jgi:hypothetical protein